MENWSIRSEKADQKMEKMPRLFSGLHIKHILTRGCTSSLAIVIGALISFPSIATAGMNDDKSSKIREDILSHFIDTSKHEPIDFRDLKVLTNCNLDRLIETLVNEAQNSVDDAEAAVCVALLAADHSKQDSEDAKIAAQNAKAATSDADARKHA
jgi:hypothetical protein